jgi:hypothetical protein
MVKTVPRNQKDAPKAMFGARNHFETLPLVLVYGEVPDPGISLVTVHV